jgi:UDP-glucose 4-epimerase
VANAFDAALRGVPVLVYGDGSTVRDYVFIDDIVPVVQRSVEDPSFADLVNVGPGVGTRLDELLGCVREVTGLELPEDRRSVRTHDIPQIILDTGRLRAAMPAYDPRPLCDGLALTWQALLDEHDRAP